MKYQLVAIGGTFDRLHKGHKYFVSKAFDVAERVLIGVTSDDFARNKIAGKEQEIKIPTQSFNERKDELDKFLRKSGLSDRADTVKIEDIYGPAIEHGEIEALLVTKDTYTGGKRVNKERKNRGYEPIDLVEIELLMAEDEKKISSSRVRRGVIDRFGRVFSMHSVFGSQVVEDLRLSLKSPLGNIIKGDPEKPDDLVIELKKRVGQIQPVMICTVGDIATLVANHAYLQQKLSIVDYKVNRIERYSSLKDVGFDQGWEGKNSDQIIRVENQPGFMTKELVGAVRQSVRDVIFTGRQRVIIVDGEEDLAGVPAILLSPLGSVVLYGQPEEGLVLVRVTEEKKEKLLKLINKHIKE